MWWYPYTSIGLFLFIALFIPKKISWREKYLTFGIVGVVTWMSDVFVDDMLKGFQLGPSPDTSIADFLFVSIVPASIAIIFLNYLPKANSWFYRFAWAFGSLVFEWGAVASGYMINKWWKTWYSIPAYLIVFFLFLPWHFRLMRQVKENKGEYEQDFIMTNGFRIRKKAR